MLTVYRTAVPSFCFVWVFTIGLSPMTNNVKVEGVDGDSWVNPQHTNRKLRSKIMLVARRPSTTVS